MTTNGVSATIGVQSCFHTIAYNYTTVFLLITVPLLLIEAPSSQNYSNIER